MCLSQLLIFDYCCLLFTQLLYSAKKLKNGTKTKTKKFKCQRKIKTLRSLQILKQTSLVCCVVLGNFVLKFFMVLKRRDEHQNVNVWCFWYIRSACHAMWYMQWTWSLKFFASHTTYGTTLTQTKPYSWFNYFHEEKNASIRQGRRTSLLVCKSFLPISAFLRGQKTK